jgi:hypothetical protein
LHHCKPMLRVWRYHYMRLSNNVWEVIFIEHFDQLCLLFCGNVLTILNVEGSHQDIHPGLDLHPIGTLWLPLEEVLHTHIAISMQPIAHQIKQSKQVKSSQVESTPKATITVQCSMPPTNQPLHSQIMPHEVESCQITWCHMSCQINPCDMPNEFMCQVKSSQVKSDEITHGQINHDQFKSCAKWCLREGGLLACCKRCIPPQASHLHE